EREPRNVVGLTIDDRGHRPRPHHPEVLERTGALAPCDEVRGGDHVPARTTTIGFPYRDQSIGIAIWQRFEHHRADDAEDGGGGTEAAGGGGGGGRRAHAATE